MEIANWMISFYKTKRGEYPVYEFFKKQRPQTQSKITHLIDLLAKYGNMLGLPHSKALGGGLYELRIRGKEELRIFYGFTQQKSIYLLHAFKKQTQETPKKELDVALQRKEEIVTI